MSFNFFDKGAADVANSRDTLPDAIAVIQTVLEGAPVEEFAYNTVLIGSINLILKHLCRNYDSLSVSTDLLSFDVWFSESAEA